MTVLIRTISFIKLGVDGRQLLEDEREFWERDDEESNKHTLSEGHIRSHILGLLIKDVAVCYDRAKRELANFCDTNWAENVQEKFDKIWSEIADYKNLTLPELRGKMRHLQFQEVRKK